MSIFSCCIPSKLPPEEKWLLQLEKKAAKTPQNSPFLKLPLEIIRLIFAKISPQNLRRLRLTCYQMQTTPLIKELLVKSAENEFKIWVQGVQRPLSMANAYLKRIKKEHVFDTTGAQIHYDDINTIPQHKMNYLSLHAYFQYLLKGSDREERLSLQQLQKKVETVVLNFFEVKGCLFSLANDGGD